MDRYRLWLARLGKSESASGETRSGEIGADGKSDILHFVVVKMPLKRSTLAKSDRASVKKLPSLSVRRPNVSGGTYGGRTQSRWLRAADGFAV
jgi:hypothetical protein